MGELQFDDCWIPEDRRIGPEGAGASIFQSTMVWERSFIFSSHVGAMQRQLDDCIAFAREREVFGQPVSRFQSVSNRIAEMKLRVVTSRLMLHRVAAMMEDGVGDVTSAALTKLHISEAFLASGLDAVRIHGGAGYLGGAQSELDLRDSLGGVIYSGTSDVQREVIARLLECD
jgi:alkylation response protein AidB-like acyl-CoA dehydrogenase